MKISCTYVPRIIAFLTSPKIKPINNAETSGLPMQYQPIRPPPRNGVWI